MKNYKILAATLACFLALSTGIAAHDEVTYAEWGTPTVDGFWEECWDNAQSIKIADIAIENDKGEYATADVYSLWDSENIYFFAEVTDPTIAAQIQDAMWDQDAIGFMLDYAYDRTAEKSYRDLGDAAYAGYVNVAAVEGNANAPEAPTIFGIAKYADAVESYTTLTDKGYDVEIKLPLALYKDYAAGDKLGFEICLNNSAEEGTFVRDSQTVWKQADGAEGSASWQYTYNMGTLILNEQPAETVAETVENGTAPQTMDAGIIAAVAAIVSATGYALSKKR